MTSPVLVTIPAVLAWKFLDAGHTTVFSGYHWPLPTATGPGPWVEASAPIEACRSGIYACRVDDLPYWLSDDLFEIELTGDIVELDRKVVGERGRLVRRLDAWSAGVARELAERAGWRARVLAVGVLRDRGLTAAVDRLESCSTLAELEALAPEVAESVDDPFVATAVGLAGDGAHYGLVGEPEQAPFVAACAAGHVASGGGGDDAAYRQGFDEERAAQAGWLAERLGLVTPN
jgi:hypothetical protein